MKNRRPPFTPNRRLAWWLPVGLAAALSACGGGGTAPDATAESAAATGGTATLQLDADAPALDPALVAEPTFHAAPVLLDAPDDTDALDPAASGRQPARAQTLPAAATALSTRRLTVGTIEEAGRMHALGAPSGENATPLATGGVVSTYSPAQVRAAYGLPPLPAAGTALTAAQRAQLGAGQTIYIVDAMHDPNVAAELAAFNAKFGLPTCTTRTLAASAALPLAAANATGCELVVAYNTAAGALTNTAPAYQSGWATEITLDVQWAHATAPLARIVLIEAPDASLNSLLGSVRLANAMGPGVVSMSFGANEGGYTASVDAAFTAANMTYLAATGDNGAAVSWPAVSANVVAVGGTSLTYSGSGSRSEVAWAGTGGGTSAYTATPAYQKLAVPGLGTVARRTVADVAFNANPSTGQYVAVIAPGSSAVKWISAGGTSLSTPQWAGLVAVANAVRASAGKAPLGAPHAALYGGIGAIPGTYASAFADVTTGTNGSCASCSSRIGYDPLTGLGTPNATGLLSALAGSSVAAQPVVGGTGGTSPTGLTITAAAMSGKVGQALTGTITVAASGTGSLSVTISGVPAGMTFSASGLTLTARWAAPVAGSYTMKVAVADSLGRTATANVPIGITAK